MCLKFILFFIEGMCSHIKTIISNMQDKKLKFRKILAKTILKYRLKTGKSICKISNEIDLTKSVWSEIEAGNRDPQLSTIWRISEGLEIPPSQILMDIEKEIGSDFFIET